MVTLVCCDGQAFEEVCFGYVWLVVLAKEFYHVAFGTYCCAAEPFFGFFSFALVPVIFGHEFVEFISCVVYVRVFEAKSDFRRDSDLLEGLGMFRFLVWVNSF